MARSRHLWWQPSLLRRDEDFDADRKVGWLELFFDLVFVVLVARLAHQLAGHLDGPTLAAFCVQFAAVFWIWNSFTYYVERFESDGLENRLFVFAAMGAVAALAVWIEDGFGEHYTGFAICYLLARLVNMAEWARAAKWEPTFRPIAARFATGYLVAAAMILGAIALHGTARIVLFGAAVLVEILTPSTTLRQQAKLPRLSTSKFPERFGLFTMIVLGESVTGVIVGLSELNEQHLLGVGQMVEGALGLLVGIGLWWIYFDFIARRPPKESIAAALGWVYLHLIVVAAITATGAGISLIISESAVDESHRSGDILLGAAVAIAMLGMAALELTLRRANWEPTHQRLSPALKVGAGIVAALTCLDLGLSVAAQLAVIVAAMAVPATYGARVWFSAENPFLRRESAENARVD